MRKTTLLLLSLLTIGTTKISQTFDCLDTVAQLIPHNPVIVEAGARFGNDTVRMSKIWPEATIHSFEPHPGSFWALYNSIKELGLPNVHLYATALSNTVGMITLYHCPTNVGASSVTKPTETVSKLWEFEEKPMHVSCTTLDEWAYQQNVSHVDFMWLDMEGHELAALKGAQTVLQNVLAIYTEVNYIETRQQIPLYKEVKNWLEKHGFVEVWRTIQPDKLQGDVLFVQQRIIPYGFPTKVLHLGYVHSPHK